MPAIEEDKVEAKLFGFGDEDRKGFNGLGETGVEEDDASVLAGLAQAHEDLVGVVEFVIAGVGIPVDGGETEGGCGAQGLVIHSSARGAAVAGLFACNLLNCDLGGFVFGKDVEEVEVGEVRVAEGVVGDFVALGDHLVQHLFAGEGHFADDKKGCGDTVFLEEFEEVIGDFAVRSVIEGEGEFGSVGGAVLEDIDAGLTGLDSGHPCRIELGVNFCAGDLPGGFLGEEGLLVLGFSVFDGE